VSERDKGIYDAMNKGVRLSAGKWFIHLNSDDYAINFAAWGKALERMKARNPGVLATDVPIMDDTDVIRYLPGRPLSSMHRRFGFHFPHQGTFFRRDVFDACGPYRLDVGYIADKLYAFRVIDMYDPRDIDYLDQPVSVQKIGGVSSSSVLTPVRTVRLTLRLSGSGYCKDPIFRALLNLVYKVRLSLHKDKKRSLAELCVSSQ
jgi:glycosyltransferase involved in cell wall biosynthesis